MAIQEQNIRLLATQVMDDVDEGGGRATSVAIVDGASNAIFPDISELDRAIGRVNLRKVDVSVNTPDTDGYFGANVIIADAPDDPLVSCTLFKAGDDFSRRVDARNQLESYVVAGPLSTMRLYGNQIAGQRAVLVYQREDQPLPEVGEVYVLSVESGAPSQQFVRIQKVEHILQVFTDGIGDFTRRVITLTISDTLRQAFTGAEPVRVSNDSSPTKIRRTTVADAAKYYGTRPLDLAASLGDLTVKADSVYVSLVPSSEQEAPIVLAGIQNAGRVTAAGDPITVPSSVWGGSGPKTLVLRGQVTPRSLSMSIGSASSFWPKTDDGAGNIILPDGTTVGSIDYLSGQLTPDASNSSAWGSVNSSTITYMPGGNVTRIAYTHDIPITLGTRGTVYTQTLRPAPAPGTFFLDYMALGKWYRLYDRGDGTISGDEEGLGAGTINYVTGAMVVTLGALPDILTSLLLAWGSPVDTRVRTANATTVDMRFKLSKTGLDGGSAAVSISYTKGGAVKTLTDNGSGVLSGGGESGTINYPTSEVTINGVRDPDTPIDITYSFGSSVVEGFAGPARIGDGTVSISATSLPIRPRSLRLSWNVVLPSPYVVAMGTPQMVITATDDGSGNIKSLTGQTIGTINYSTGLINWDPDTVVKVPQAQRSWNGSGQPVFNLGTTLQDADAIAPLDFDVEIEYRDSSTVDTFEEQINPPIGFFLMPNSVEQIVAGSAVFELGDSIYVERSGTLVRDPSLTTGVGTDAGSVDFKTTRVSVTKWPAGLSGAAPVVRACLTEIRGRMDIDVAFRTAGAPIRPASFYVQANDVDGTLLTATANQGGTISGTYARGTVNNTTGVVNVEFGQMVTAAGNESEPWYFPENVVGGQIWKPREVQPATIKYNSVIVSRLPLDAGIIGLDPVRLPSDGRVPVLRTGDVAVIHHTATTTPQTVSNGQTIDVGRIRLSRARVIGNNGATITAGYSVDLDAGTVTFDDVSGYSQPVKVEHRIEDMALIGDAQINGQIALTRQLTHNFPLGSLISSALIIGDMRARVPILFDQATWNSTWSDVRVGADATGTFNDVLAPIAVTNAGAITERWIVRFTNTTSFEVIGEHVGVIATGNTATNCAPTNPMAGAPYFTIPAAGWGSGWAAGNVLRFNTIGALFPLWIARTIQQGQASAQSDSFTILIRGDIDRP